MPIRIDQVSLPAGEPGFARNDGLSTGAVVTLTDTTPGGSTVFEILWVSPEDNSAVSSLAVTGDNHVWTFAPTAGVTGPIRIRLTHTDDNGGVVVETRIFGIADASGQIPPAPGERSDPSASLLNATDPEIIAACERNWKTDEFPDGNPFGWAFDVAGGTASPAEPLEHASTHVGGSDPIPLASTTTDGLMSVADRNKLDGLGGPTEPTTHAAKHVGGADPIPLASQTTDGLMSIADRNKLDSLGGAAIPAAHAETHVGGADAIPVATTSADGLMSRTDKNTLDNLVNTGTSPHSETHVGGTDPIPVATASADGLMSKTDKSTLDELANAETGGPHADTHVGGSDPIPLAAATTNGLMSIVDKNKLDAIAEPAATHFLPLATSQEFTFPDIDTVPRGYVLVRQGGNAAGLTFTPPSGHSILTDVGDKLQPDAVADSYTLYEYVKRGQSGLITVLRKKLAVFVPPVPLPVSFGQYGVGLWSVQDLLHNDYTGPLFRVRRANDNAEMDIGVGPDGTCNVAALANFCGSAQGFVTKLYGQNQIGSPHDFYQTTPAAQPLIYDGSDAVRAGSNVLMQFDGVDDFLVGDHSIGLEAASSQGGNVYMAWKPMLSTAVPVTTPASIRVAFCLGGDKGAWAVGQTADLLMNSCVGRSLLRWGSLPSANFCVTTANVPKSYNTTTGVAPRTNKVQMTLGSPSTNATETQAFTGLKTSLGKTVVTANDYPAVFTYGFFGGAISTIVVQNRGMTPAANDVYYVDNWFDERRVAAG